MIGGRTGGIPEAIVDGDTGLFEDPESPADMAERLLTFLTGYVQPRALSRSPW